MAKKTPMEKLRILLPHWIEHNHNHEAEFKKWAEQIRNEGEGAVADLLDALSGNAMHDRAREIIEAHRENAGSALEAEASEIRVSGQIFCAAAGSARQTAGDTEGAIRWYEMALEDETIPNADRADWIDLLISAYDEAGRESDAVRWRKELKEAVDD